MRLTVSVVSACRGHVNNGRSFGSIPVLYRGFAATRSRKIRQSSALLRSKRTMNYRDRRVVIGDHSDRDVAMQRLYLLVATTWEPGTVVPTATARNVGTAIWAQQSGHSNLGTAIWAQHRCASTTYHLSPLTYHLSASHLSPVGYRLSPIAYRLPPITYRLSPTAYRLPPIAYRLPPIAYRLSYSVAPQRSDAHNQSAWPKTRHNPLAWRAQYQSGSHDRSPPLPEYHGASDRA